MLDCTSPRYLHFLLNASLIALSFGLLFPTLYVVACSYVLQILLPRRTRSRARRIPGFRPHTILVTGVGMSKGLHLARTFHLAGHDVIGADFEAYHVPVAGRFSRALRHFYSLSYPGAAEYPPGKDRYKQQMLRIVQTHQVALWVSCSGVATAVEDARIMAALEEETGCKCIQFGEEMTGKLDDKARFSEFLENIKLPTPEAHLVRSRSDVHRLLAQRPRGDKKKFILKSVGMSDAVRGDMTLLPRRTTSSTYDHVSAVPISGRQPFILQEFVKGEEYCTHALVVNNKVQTFTVCRSLDLLMHYEPLEKESPLHSAMLAFTQGFLERVNERLTGHLSFDFMVRGKSSMEGVELGLFAIECNPRAHTAVCLFQGNEREVARRYLAATESMGRDQGHRKLTNGLSQSELGGSSLAQEPVYPDNVKAVYWIGHDLVTLVLHPILQFFTWNISVRALLEYWYQFVQHVLFWKDGTFEIWDPLPFFVLYHIYWPGMFMVSILFGSWWSRINVSTTKRFTVV